MSWGDAERLKGYIPEATTQNAIIQVIKDAVHPLSTAEIAEQLGRPVRGAVEKAIYRLIAKGILERRPIAMPSNLPGNKGVSYRKFVYTLKQS
jgi:predicted transcriptional regulator